MTNLTAALAEDVVEKPLVEFVSLVIQYDSGSFGEIPTPRDLEKLVNEDVNLQKKSNSKDHVRIISQKKTAALENYKFDPVLGRGQTIYLLNGGFNTQHEEFGGIRSVGHCWYPTSSRFRNSRISTSGHLKI